MYEAVYETFEVKVNNLEEYAFNHNYIVVRLVNGEFWFYGAYDTEERANEVAIEIGNGGVFRNAR